MNFKSISNKYYLILLLFILIFTTYFTYLSFLRHEGLKTDLADLGMIQAVYNTLHGRFLMLSDVSRLYLHTNFILVLFAPLYYFFSTPKLLMFSQILIASLGVFPIFWLARDKLKSKNLGLFFAFLYLINPHLQDAVLRNFHPVVLAASFLFFAFYFLENKKYIKFFIFAALAILCKENVALMVMMMGVYHFFINKQRKAGLLVAFWGLASFLIIMQLIIPYFNSGESHPFFRSSHYSYLGTSVGDVSKNILTNPFLLLTKIFEPSSLVYLIFLLVPLGFISVFCLPVLLIASPDFFINILTIHQRHPLGFYHQIITLSFIFIAAIYAFSFFQKKYSFNFVVTLVLVLSIGFSLLFSPAPYSLLENRNYYKVSDEARFFHDKVKDVIPKDASLSVQNNLGSHFLNREKIYLFPRHFDEVDYVLISLNDPYFYYSPWRAYDFFIAIFGTKGLEDYFQSIEEIFSNEDHGVLFYQNGYYIFKKNFSRESNEVARSSFLEDYANLYENIKRKGLDQCNRKLLGILPPYYCIRLK